MHSAPRQARPSPPPLLSFKTPRSQPKEQGLLPLQELDENAKSALGTKGGLPPTTVVDRLRKRLRMNGYRCHLTLQVNGFRGQHYPSQHLHEWLLVPPHAADDALAA